MNADDCDAECTDCATDEFLRARREAYESGKAVGVASGAAEERARIVAWLRGLDRRSPKADSPHAAADMIERGEHMGTGPVGKSE